MSSRQDNLQENLSDAASLHPRRAADSFRLNTHTHSHTQSRAKVWTHCSLEYDENKQLDVLTPTAGLTRKAF